MIRYEDAPSRVYKVLKFVRDGWFPELKGARILPVFDLKQSRSKGKVTLASIRLASDLQKYLTMEGTQESTGYDYILIIDKIAWKKAGKSIKHAISQDRIRLIRHELRHTRVSMSAQKPYGLRSHTVEDFYSEIKLNNKDPRWAERLATNVGLAYKAKKIMTRAKGYENKNK